MESFWNKGEKEIIKGLDVLGLRSVNQHIESQLVSSITTIFIRAREYYSPKEIERIDYEQEAPPKKKEAIMKTIGEMSMEERLYIKCNK